MRMLYDGTPAQVRKRYLIILVVVVVVFGLLIWKG